MAHRIEIGLKRGVFDARGHGVVGRAKGFLGLPVTSCQTRDCYKIEVNLSTKELKSVRQAFTDPVIAKSAIDRLRAPAFDWMIEVGFKPGVTDNVGRTACALVEDVIDRRLAESEDISTSIQYFLRGTKLTRENVSHIGRELVANTLIHTIDIYTPEEWAQSPVNATIPRMPAETEITVKTYDLRCSDDELMRISREGILSLSLEELHAIRDYYAKPHVIEERAKLGLPDQPTDLELECLAQTWSEHCSHKIFAGDVHYVDENGKEEYIRSIFKTYIRDATKKIGEQVDWLVSVFVDNAGVIKFNDRLNLVYKVETHNSPSALDPYGGAITGIVGVNRDPMGTGMGAELLFNVWGYCLGSPFYDGHLPEGLFHPRIIRDGVHQGVIDGGNQSGIPYARGFERFDDRYIGKPLVYCGTVGKLPKEVNGEPSEEKRVHPGDLVVMAGGRIGKDGIHGATFSSEELRQESPAQAVQIGDAFMQRKLYEFVIEARDRGLYNAITDNGAGGLSSSAGEMAEFSGGLDIDVAKAPLKYEGLQPWEIFLSEAQERMTFAVPAGKIDAFMKLAERREVEATVLGTFTDSGELIVRHEEKIVGCIDMGFLHEGCPVMQIEAKWDPPNISGPNLPRKGKRNVQLKKLLGRLNVCSKEYKSRRYDHEVKGRSIVKPFIGVYSDTPSDATILLAEYESYEGVVLAEGINPFYSDLDTYHMTASVIDEAVRRIISVGGSLNSIAGLDNFCWPDPIESEKTPDGRYKMAQLVRSNKALYDYTTAYKVPCISGKDSMKNDSVRGGRKISIPPTLLFSTIGKIEDARRAVTMYFKQPGDHIYVVGLTKNELGASEFYRMLAEDQGEPTACGGAVPTVDAEAALSCYEAMQRAHELGLLRSSHTPTVGGLAVAFAFPCIGGDLGADIDLAHVPNAGTLDTDELLFSESNSRFVVTCSPENAPAFEDIMNGTPTARAGVVTGDGLLRVKRADGVPVIQQDIAALRKAFKKTLEGI